MPDELALVLFDLYIVMQLGAQFLSLVHTHLFVIASGTAKHPVSRPLAIHPGTLIQQRETEGCAIAEPHCPTYLIR